MENLNLDHDPTILTQRPRDGLPIFTTRPHAATRSHDYSRMLHVYAGTFFVMYASLVGFIQVKSQNLTHSLFETHGLFIIMSLFSLPVAIITSGLLFYTKDHLDDTNQKDISSIRDMVLKTVFSLSTILAPLSLIPVLFIPSELNWIGYSIICAVFTTTTTYNFLGYVLLHKKKDVSNFAAIEMV